MSSLLIDQPGESAFHDPTEITQWIPKSPPATGPRGDVPAGGKYNDQIKDLEKLYSPAGQGVDRFRVQSDNDLTIAGFNYRGVTSQDMSGYGDDWPKTLQEEMEDSNEPEETYEQLTLPLDLVRSLFIDPNNMYADASDLTNTLAPFQNPRSGSLRDMDDESRKELLIRGVEAFKKAEAPRTITGPRTPGTIRGIPHLDSPFIDRWLRDRRNSSGPQLPHFV